MFAFVLTVMAALHTLLALAVIYGLKTHRLKDASGSQVGATFLLMFFVVNMICFVLCAMALNSQG